MNRTVFRATAAVALIAMTGLLSACDFFKEEKPRLPGERISVMLYDQELEPDPSLADLSVVLPKPKNNLYWPQAGGGPTHSVGHPELADNIKRVWSASVGTGNSEEEEVTTSPLVVDGVVYTVDADYRVSAFDLKTGREKWHMTPQIPEEDDDAFGGGLAFFDNTVLLSTGFAEVIAIDANTHEEKWRTSVDAPVRGAPAVADGVAVVVTIDNQSYALDVKSGELLWTHTGLSEVAGVVGGSTPAIDGDAVLVPYTSGEIFSLNLRTGRVNWSDSLTALRRVDAVSSIADIRALPVIDRGVAYAVSHSGRMAAYDLRSGARIWDKRIGGVNMPWVAGEFVYILTNDSNVVCLTRRGGQVKWLSILPQWKDPDTKEDPIIWTGPVLAGDRLIVGNADGEVWTLSPYTGDVLGKENLGSGVSIKPIVADGTLLFQTDSGSLIAYR